MASITKQSVLCLILFFYLSLEISLASPIRELPTEPNDEYPYDFDSNYDGEEYDYETEEINVNTSYKCPGQFLIVPKESLCDGFPDCFDNSDESREICEEYQVEIVETTTFPSFVDSVSTTTLDGITENRHLCSLNEFPCPSETGLCIPENAICDGTGDCPEGEDELFCTAGNLFDAFDSSSEERNPHPRNTETSSSNAEDWTFDEIARSEPRPEHLPHHRSGKLYRLLKHKQTKMRKSMSNSGLPNTKLSHSATIFNPRTLSSKNPMRFFDNPPFVRETDSDSTPRSDKAEFSTMLRQLPMNSERSRDRTGIPGETGETIAADYLTHLSKLTDKEAEIFLRAYASLSSTARENNQNNSQGASMRTLLFPSVSAETSLTSIKSKRPKTTNHVHGHKKKLKTSINKLIRRFGKLLGSSTFISEHDMNINISIQNHQNDNDYRDTKQESNQQSENESKITLKLEMTL